jgi:type IV secretion system protein VirB2
MEITMKNFLNTLKPYLTNVRVEYFVLVLLATLMIAEPSFAQNFQSIDNVFSKMTAWVTGPIGKSVATIALVGVGITFVAGRMDWQFAIAIMVGIAVIFSAATIANSF